MPPLPLRAAPLGVLALLGVLLAVAVVHTQIEITDPTLAAFLDDYLFNATQVGFALVAIWRGVAVRTERAAWLVIGVSMLMWCSGNVVWSFFLPTEIPIPSLSDAAWLGACPGFYLGLWLLFRARTSGVARSSLLDGAVVGLAVGAVCAAAAVEAVWKTIGGSSRLEVAINLAYPLGDLILLSLVAAAIVAAGRRPSISWALLARGGSPHSQPPTQSTCGKSPRAHLRTRSPRCFGRSAWR